jgi:hypothetical protein
MRHTVAPPSCGAQKLHPAVFNPNVTMEQGVENMSVLNEEIGTVSTLRTAYGQLRSREKQQTRPYATPRKALRFPASTATNQKVGSSNLSGRATFFLFTFNNFQR